MEEHYLQKENRTKMTKIRTDERTNGRTEKPWIQIRPPLHTPRRKYAPFGRGRPPHLTPMYSDQRRWQGNGERGGGKGNGANVAASARPQRILASTPNNERGTAPAAKRHHIGAGGWQLPRGLGIDLRESGDGWAGLSSVRPSVRP